MPLRKPTQLSERKTAANRENARRSTGPRTPAGKRRASLNALTHGLRARALGQTMRELGESPQDYARLHLALLSSFQPANAVEAKLVEDLARLWWKKDRADRAQLGLQAYEVKKLEMEQLRRASQMNRQSFDATSDEVLETGLLRAKDCPGKFDEALTYLKLVVKAVEERDYNREAEVALQALYGKVPPWRGNTILSIFRRLRDSEPEPPAPPAAQGAEEAGHLSPSEEQRACLLLQFHEEIRDVLEDYELFRTEHLTLSSAMVHACLAPPDARWTWTLRLDNSLERQIDRKLKLLLRLRSARNKICPELTAALPEQDQNLAYDLDG
jgi:hypothetical protein